MDELLMLQDLEKQKIAVQVFGTQSSSETLLLSTLGPKQIESNHFNAKIIESCLLLGQDMGTLYLLRFSCKQWNPNLIKVCNHVLT